MAEIPPPEQPDKQSQDIVKKFNGYTVDYFANKTAEERKELFMLMDTLFQAEVSATLPPELRALAKNPTP